MFSSRKINYNLQEMFWYRWEYFAYNAPLWKKDLINLK